MSKTLHARCPGCHTIFAVTAAQLDAHGGLVRCGRCAAVFQAERHAVDPPAPSNRKRQSKTERRATAGKRSDAKAATKRQKRAARKVTAEPRTVAEPVELPTPAEFVTPALAKILLTGRSSHMRRGLWALATLVLVALLAVQVVYFYASELARSPQLEPWVAAACARLGCVIRPPQDIRQSSLVNRADFAQPFPLMEVTLTSRNGEVVARRTYLPHEYLAPPYWRARMTPHVVIDGILDINHPTPAPAGYEIRLIAAP
jgi:predicted Zn finger-like uncharacterized protein